jgi:poly-gamma-glutamate synthesis protein (capsule biosynthesis protein)
VRSGAAHFTPEELQRGLIVHLGTHVAAVMEDREPLGILDDGDLVAHQLKDVPEILKLGELLKDRKKTTFDLLRAPAPQADAKLLFGGDVMLGRSCAAKIDQGLDPFSGIKDLLAQSSFAAANLECTISAAGAPRDHKSYSFRAPNRSAEFLQKAGFRAIGLANNHASDFGADALRDCADKLSREKVEPIGVGRESSDAYTPKYFSLNGKDKLAVLAINDVGMGPPEIARASERGRLAVAIDQAQAGASLVVCLVHWGTENIDIVTERQRELARWLVDRGVDVVVGSHPHCVQPLDFYRGRPIAYSLGNLVFDGAPTIASWNRGALLQMGLSKTHKVSRTELIPVLLEDGLPKIAPPSNGVLAKQ